jgi:PAS domain S-box-containing protein
MSAALPAMAVVECFPSPALVVDARGRIAAANEAIARCLTSTPQQLVGSELAAWAADPAELADFLRADSLGAREFHFRASNGGERHLRICLGKSVAGGDLLTVLDVTPRRAAEERLQEDVARFRDMIGAGSGWFWELDATMTRIRFFRHSREKGAITVMELSAIFPDEVLDQTYNTERLAVTMRRHAAREPDRDLVCRWLTNGEEGVRYSNVSSVPFYDADGVYQGRRGVSVDITAQVTAEEALRESEARLRSSKQHLEQAQRVSAMASVERDLVTGAEEWSEPAYRLFGVDRRSFSLTHANILDFVHDEDREKVAQMIAMAEAGRPPPPGEFRIVQPQGGIRTLYCQVELIHDEAGKAVRQYSVFKDSTALRAAEKRQHDMERQQHQSQKLEVLGTLAGSVAHELNNTLVPILALTKVTAERLAEGTRERKNLETIVDAGEKALALVAQILAFSRKDAPMRGRIDLGELVRDSLKMLRASVPATIRIEQRVAAVPPLLGEPGQLHQVVTNLVTNAAHAIGGAHGTITVEVAPAPAEQFHDAQHAPDAAVRLSVSDTGCGMSEATMARVFEPFFTTRPPGEGTGLGLSVVHGIITQHGGRVALESREERGTRFDIYLPALAAEVAARFAETQHADS